MCWGWGGECQPRHDGPTTDQTGSQQTWLYRDMELPKRGSVVLWLRVFTQLWNLQDVFKTILRLYLNKYLGVWGACGGRHAPGTYQDIPLGVSVLTIYEACSSLIFMFKYSNSLEIYRICLQQYLDSIWIVLGCRVCCGVGWGVPTPSRRTHDWPNQKVHKHGYRCEHIILYNFLISNRIIFKFAGNMYNA